MSDYAIYYSIALFVFQDHTISNHHSQEPPNSTCDLSSLDPLCSDSEEILRQLAENPFDVESFFTEFNSSDRKVSDFFHKLSNTKQLAGFSYNESSL